MNALAVRPIDVQRRLVELGRIRLGQKAPGKGNPQRLETFRLTSASRSLLEAAAAIYGGQVREWTDAPDPGYHQLTTTSRELDVLIPPTLASYSQWYELWDAGGCIRRCDGERERIADGPCLCDPQARECTITTRVSVMLPRLPGLGVWRLDTHGWNAATTLPSTLELLGAASHGAWVRAVLRAVARSKRVRVEGKAITHRWTEPQLDVPDTMDSLMAVGPEGAPGIVARTDRREMVPRPALPPGPDLPSDTVFSFSADARAIAPPRVVDVETGEVLAPPPEPDLATLLRAAAETHAPDEGPATPEQRAALKDALGGLKAREVAAVLTQLFGLAELRAIQSRHAQAILDVAETLGRERLIAEWLDLAEVTP